MAQRVGPLPTRSAIDRFAISNRLAQR